MNARKSLYDIKSFYNKKAVLKASYEGMRYQVQQVEVDEEKKLRAVVWPEPFCFEKTAEDKKETALFPYDEEGLDAVYDWLVTQYEERKDYWRHAKEHPLEDVIEKE